jgi:hypothetical protein
MRRKSRKKLMALYDWVRAIGLSCADDLSDAPTSATP